MCIPRTLYLHSSYSSRKVQRSCTHTYNGHVRTLTTVMYAHLQRSCTHTYNGHVRTLTTVMYTHLHSAYSRSADSMRSYSIQFMYAYSHSAYPHVIVMQQCNTHVRTFVYILCTLYLQYISHVRREREACECKNESHSSLSLRLFVLSTYSISVMYAHLHSAYSRHSGILTYELV